MEVVENILFRFLEARPVSATKNKIPRTEIQVIRERVVSSSWENTIQLLILLQISPYGMFVDKKASWFRPETIDFYHILRLALFAWYDGTLVLATI